eukprot:747419-Hanusia_phi.AAC.10
MAEQVDPQGPGGRDRRRMLSTAVIIGCALALLLLVLGVVQTRGTASEVWVLKGKRHAAGVKESSFAKWFREQSAATWFGKQTFQQKLAKEKAQKLSHWLTQHDVHGMQSVIKSEAKRRLKAKKVELAMAKLARKEHSDKLAKALKEELASYNELDDVRTRKARLSQELAEYQPIRTDGDYADLPEARVLSVINSLNNNFQCEQMQEVFGNQLTK